MKPIVEGIIAVANHKLRVEGVDAYKKYLEQIYYFQEDIDEEVKKERERVALDLKNLAFEFFRDELAYDIFIKRLNEICGTHFLNIQSKQDENNKSISEQQNE